MTATEREPRPTRPQRAVVGIAVGAAWIAGLFVAAPLVGGVGLVAIAEAIITRSPGWLSTLAVSRLGFYAQPVLVAGIGAAILVGTLVGAVLWPRDAPVGPYGPVLVGAAVTIALFHAVGAGPSVGAAVGLFVALGPPYLVTGLLGELATSENRRGFLTDVGRIAIVGTVSLAGLRLLFDRLAGPRESERVEEPLAQPVSPPDGDPAFDFDGMPSAVTAPGDHYVVDITVTPPRIDPDQWTLDVDGAVENPYQLTYDELLEHDERVEQTVTMICISNRIGGDLIGSGHWTGVQLSDLIAAADPSADAVDVVTHAADGYSEAIPLDLIEREDILIAYGMGDRTLATEHGFPARLLIPGRYGMKMTKWIDRIEIVEEEHEAYWQARGWDEAAVVNTMSYVRGAERVGDRVAIGGVAFAGLESGVEEIRAVEVSVDGGDTWHEAALEEQLDVHAWRRWRYEFDAPTQTEFDVVVRAIERDGTVQTDEETSPRPSGATGWHRTVVEV